jgi:hypothetical protein
MQKCREAHRQDHAPRTRDNALPHHWLISPAWCYALSAFDFLEKERRRLLERTLESIGDLEE